MKQNSKFHSSTLWLAICSLALVPLSWTTQFFINRAMLKFMIDQGMEDPTQLSHLFISIPLGPVVTLATFGLTVYGARRAGREISTNLTLPVGQNASTTDQLK